MARSITYTFEDANGVLHDFEVLYTISSGCIARLEQPPEEPEINISSVQENGVEVENIDDKTYELIEKQIWDSENNEPDPDYDYDFGDLD